MMRKKNERKKKTTKKTETQDRKKKHDLIISITLRTENVIIEMSDKFVRLPPFDEEGDIYSYLLQCYLN